MGVAPRLPSGGTNGKTVFVSALGEMLYLQYFEGGVLTDSDSIYYFRGELVDFHGVTANVIGDSFVVTAAKRVTGFSGTVNFTFAQYEIDDQILKRRYTDGAYVCILYP